MIAMVALAVACAFAAPAQAATATRIAGGAGGSFTNPCNEDAVTYSVDLTGELVSSTGTFLVELEGAGTGSDLVSGETYDVTFTLASPSAQDGSGSFTGQYQIVFVGQQATFVIHLVANVNFRPGEPVIIEIADATCAGIGPRSF